MSRPYLLLFGLFATLLSTALVGAEPVKVATADELYEIDEVEVKVVKEKLVKKKKAPLAERVDLALYGNVQVKFQDFREVLNGRAVRGPIIPILPDFELPKDFQPNQVWSVEANIWLDHRGDCTWATINLRFKTNLGSVSGAWNQYSLERAFIGFKLWDGCCSRGQLEFGRMKLGDRFQSELQYNSRFDGVVFELRRDFCDYGPWTVKAGVMVVDFRTRHYTWIVGWRWDEIWKSGYYVDLSFIDWSRGRRVFFPDILFPLPDPFFQYRNFQVVLGYKFPLERFCRPVHASIGWIINEAASRQARFNNYLGNQAWWIAFEIGSIVKACDWAFKFSYQWVGLQSILETDVSGIGRGNADGGSIHSRNIFDPSLLFGNTNYKGVAFTFSYGITDNITFLAEYYYSTEITGQVGGLLKYTKAEGKITYAF